MLISLNNARGTSFFISFIKSIVNCARSYRWRSCVYYISTVHVTRVFIEIKSTRSDQSRRAFLCKFYKRIPSPEKSHNNKSGKIRYFTCVWYRQSAAERHSPFAPLSQVDEWTAKPSWFSVQGSFSELPRIMAAKTLKKSVSLTDSDVQTFLEGEENQYTKRKTESYVFSGFGVGMSRGWEWKLTTGRFTLGRFRPFTWKTSSVGKDKVNKWEFCKFKITPIDVFIIKIQRIFPSS